MRACVITFVMIAFALVAFAPGVRPCTIAVLNWIEQAGMWAPAVLVLIYVVATVGMIPGTLLTLGAGAIFGLWIGTLSVVIGSNLGAIAAFGLGRTLMRSCTETMIARNRSLIALDQAVAAEGFRIVLLSRLSPLFPFNLLNYAFGMTRVSLRDYALASAVGMLPGTLLYVYLGAAAGGLATLTADGSGSETSRLSFTIGLIGTVILTLYLHRLAGTALAGHDLVGTCDSAPAENKPIAEQEVLTLSD